MGREATCFSCRHVLRVSPDAQGRWLTCPRCLASVGNPYVLLPAASPSSSLALPLPAPPPSPEPSLCPGCQRETEPNWRVCPHCERPLRDVRPRSDQASLDDSVQGGLDDEVRQGSTGIVPLVGSFQHQTSLDDEVRRDSRGVNVIALVLGGLLVLGAVLFVVVGGPVMVQSAPDPGQVLFFGLLAIGVFVGGLIALAFGARIKAATAVSGVLSGLVVGAGVVLLVVLVACLTVLAAIANFLHNCGCK